MIGFASRSNFQESSAWEYSLNASEGAKVKSCFTTAAAALVLIASSTAAAAQNGVSPAQVSLEGLLAEGAPIYRSRCASCHGRNGEGQRQGHDGAPRLGGPTSAASSVLSLHRQFWTSRSFAVVDVNYRGSTGYGRDYRFRLEGRWGVADVDDCIAAARYLAENGDADPNRIGIAGGSAGGFTALCALTFHDFFTTGASHYGIGDLELLASGTHKFEARYLDWLVGPYPQQKKRYVERSPINHVEKLNGPVAFFQGEQDKVVPPDQARKMVDALRANGNPALYLLFEDEQHGFRKSANIRRALDAELLFFSIWLSGRDLRFSGDENPPGS